MKSIADQKIAGKINLWEEYILLDGECMENVNDVGNCGKELVVVAGTTKETSMAAAAWQRGERND